MEIRFNVTPPMLYKAQRALARHVPWLRWGGLWMIGVILVPLLMVGLSSSSSGTAGGVFRANWGTIGPILFFLLLWFVGIPLLQRWSAGRLWRASPALQGEQVWVVEPTEFSVSNPVSRTTITWDAIVRAAETADFIFLFPSKQVAQFLPKSAIASEADLHRIRQIIASALGPRAKAMQRSTLPQPRT